MSDIEKDNLEFDDMDDESVVVMTDEDGNEYYYHEELIIPMGNKRYAVLVPLDDVCDCEEENCSCVRFDETEETDIFIARIDIDEDGEEIYIDPTDEEFEQVCREYERLMEDGEE